MVSRKEVIVFAIVSLFVLATVATAAAVMRTERIRPRYVYHGMQTPDATASDVTHVAQTTQKGLGPRSYGETVYVSDKEFASMDHASRRAKYATMMKRLLENRKQRLGTPWYSRRMISYIEKYAPAEEAPATAEQTAELEAMEQTAYQEQTAQLAENSAQAQQ